MRKKLLLSLFLLVLLTAGTACSQTNETATTSTADRTRTAKQEKPANSNQPSETATADNQLRQLSGKRLLLTVGDQSFPIALYDNPTADDLYNQLPLTLTVNDYDGWDEKIIPLSKKLSMNKAPDGDEPRYPEVGYYEPGNWIALYYGEIGYWSGKVPLGSIEATAEELAALPDGARIRLEIANSDN